MSSYEGFGDSASKDISKISLVDILIFIKKFWKIILIFSAVGFSCAAIFLAMSTHMYEAVAQIRVAQLSQLNALSPQSALFEDAPSIIARMKFPTNYTSEVMDACGYEASSRSAAALSKDVQFSIPKGTLNTIEVRTLSKSQKVAINCVSAVFEKIKSLQDESSNHLISEATVKIDYDNERIDAAKKLVAKADQSGGAMSAAYLTARDEITYFLTDREKMTDLVNSVKSQRTKLAAPIYSPDTHVYPKKLTALLIGLVLGAFLGFLICLAPSIKNIISIS